MGYEDDDATKSRLKSYLKRSDDEWKAAIPEKYRDIMEKIRDMPNSIEASEKIKDFMKSNDDDDDGAQVTKILIRFRALQIEDLINASLVNFIGYICQKSESSKNSVSSAGSSQIDSLSLVFKVTSNLGGEQLDGILILPILPKIVMVQKSETKKVVRAWMPGTAYIKPIEYLDGLNQRTFFRSCS